jgi:hypothetical protein
MLLVFNDQRMICDFRAVLRSVPDPYLARAVKRPREKTGGLPAIEKERFTSARGRNQAAQSEVLDGYGSVGERFRVPPEPDVRTGCPEVRDAEAPRASAGRGQAPGNVDW